MGWVISAKKPHWIKKAINSGILLASGNGLYQFTSGEQIKILIINEMPIKKENYIFLLFSTDEKLKEYIKEVMHDEQERKLQGLVYILYYNYNLVIEMAEAQEIPMTDMGRNIKEAIEHLGIRNVLEQLGIARVVKEVGVAEVVKEVGVAEVVKEVGVAEVVKEIGMTGFIKHLDKNQVKKLSKKEFQEMVDTLYQLREE